VIQITYGSDQESGNGEKFKLQLGQKSPASCSLQNKSSCRCRVFTQRADVEPIVQNQPNRRFYDGVLPPNFS
jgi:hypothetical protein